MAIAEDTIHFVGGRGDNTGDADAGGGCTKVAWDASLDLSDFMDTHGEPVVSDTGALTQDGADAVVTKASAFGSVVVGTICYLHDYAAGTPGRYKITAQTANTITLEDAWTAAEDPVSVEVGGAFTDIQDALDKTDATEIANRWIYTRKAETLAGTVTVTNTGSATLDWHIFVVGYKTQPGDMDPGGAYWGGAWDAFHDYHSRPGKMNNPDAEWVTYTISNDGFQFASRCNVHFHNIKVIDDGGANLNAFDTVSVSHGVHFKNCVVIDAGAIDYGWNGDFLFSSFDDCYIYGTTYTFQIHYGNNNLYKNCIVDTPLVAAFLQNTNNQSGVVSNCLFIGGSYALHLNSAGLWVIENCTCYGQTVAAIPIVDNKLVVHVNNNIFDLAAAGDYAVSIGANNGSLISCDYNCTWQYGTGDVLTHPYYDTDKAVDLPQVGANNIEADPLFVDAANGDFRLQENSPCINSGRQGNIKGYTSMGAWQRKSFLGQN